jgi:hypothetical protein
MTSSRTDPFAQILGSGRGSHHDDVLLVEDHAGHGIGRPDPIALFATRSEKLAADIAAIHLYAARTNGDKDPSSITVRWVPFVEYARRNEHEFELWGPGELGRATAAEEAIVMGVPWPLPAG